MSDWTQLSTDEKLDAMHGHQLIIGVAAGTLALAALAYALYRGSREDNTELRIKDIELELERIAAMGAAKRMQDRRFSVGRLFPHSKWEAV